MITTVAFDADDTLWHNERLFLHIKDKFCELLSAFHSADWIGERLDETEGRNIRKFGYGIKAFTLSMIETACELTEGRITGREILEIVEFAKEMIDTPLDILEGVEETIKTLAPQYRLMVITKGDIFDQEEKLARSGLGDYFQTVEIVSQKNVKTYQSILFKHQIHPNEFLMVGNSLKSDILPIVELKSHAVFIPYETEWVHEKVSDDELNGKNFTTLEKIQHLPEFLKTFRISGN